MLLVRSDRRFMSLTDKSVLDSNPELYIRYVHLVGRLDARDGLAQARKVAL